MIRSHVVLAIFRRNFVSYFSSPTGYVFIAVFIILSAAMAFWRDVFFANNLANLDTLNAYFPKLLLFFIPAVAMGVWSEERKQGTDELLLTLPVRDAELVLGKYLAALGIYSVSLGFSMSHVLVLMYLGSPDLGVMFGTYLGYGFLGASLLALAMVASLLTSSMTVAFILGALFCVVPVFLGDAGAITGGRLETWLENAGVAEPFKDFTSGVISLRGLFFFLSFTALMLYLNLVLLGRRLVRNETVWLHQSARAFSLLGVGICLGILGTRSGCRVDVTAERLHTLTPGTRELLRKIDRERPVLIQAYVSPEVPQDYVQVRENLLATLRDFDAIGGDSVHLTVFDTEKFSPEARDADEKFGIKPVPVADIDESHQGVEEVFLGVAFTCGLEEVVVPFLHRGLSVEYELTRSLGTVAGQKRKKVGVASTDARIAGGFDMGQGGFRQLPEWGIVGELKKQYEIVQVALDQPVTETYDALLVVMPSSLSQPQMDNLLAYIRRGAATLLFDDPFPTFNGGLAPNEPKQAPGRGGQFGMPPPEQKGDIRKFLETLGIVWVPETIVWDKYNPHPLFKDQPEEVVFVGPGGGNAEAFNTKEAITSGLQEFVAIVAGEIGPDPRAALTFTPLLGTSGQNGTLLSSQMFERNFMGGMSLNQYRPHRPSAKTHTLAARVQGTLPASAEPPKEGQAPAQPSQVNKVNVLMVADADCIGDQFFQLRQRGGAGLNFDNVTFVLNAVDVMAGDETFVGLRKRRAKHRTLQAVENRVKIHNDKLVEKTKEAEEKAEKNVKEAQDRVNAAIQALKDRKDVDVGRMEAEVGQLLKVENQRLEAQKKEIEDRKKSDIEKSQGEKELAVRAIQRGIKAMALILPPILPALIAIVFFFRRLAAQDRRVAA